MIDDPSEGAAAGFFRHAWRKVCSVLRGFKTLLTAFALLAGGLLDQFDLVDVLNYVKQIFGENARVGSIIVAVVIVFVILRVVTKTPLFGSTAVKPGVDEGA